MTAGGNGIRYDTRMVGRANNHWLAWIEEDSEDLDECR
jgi:hypothetical protein